MYLLFFVIIIIFLPGQLSLFISTLSIAISPVNEVPAIPSNVTCKKFGVFVNIMYTFHLLIGVIKHAYISLCLPASHVGYYAG